MIGVHRIHTDEGQFEEGVAGSQNPGLSDVYLVEAPIQLAISLCEEPEWKGHFSIEPGEGIDEKGHGEFDLEAARALGLLD